MDYLAAIEEKIVELRATAQSREFSSFDAWDQAEIEYLEEVRDRLARGMAPGLMYEELKNDLRGFEDEVAREEACPTFDWYDDHYHEKLCSGRLAACRAALEIYEAITDSGA